MRELLLESLGWLGYLERVGVLLQLLALALLLVIGQLPAVRRWRRGRPPLLASGVAIGLALLLSLALQLAGEPAGLLQTLAVLWLGWSLLAGLELLLLRRLPPPRGCASCSPTCCAPAIWSSLGWCCSAKSTASPTWP